MEKQNDGVQTLRVNLQKLEGGVRTPQVRLKRKMMEYSLLKSKWINGRCAPSFRSFQLDVSGLNSTSLFFEVGLRRVFEPSCVCGHWEEEGRWT